MKNIYILCLTFFSPLTLLCYTPPISNPPSQTTPPSSKREKTHMECFPSGSREKSYKLEPNKIPKK